MEMLKIMDISRDSIISEILESFPEAMPKFQDLGMHCLGCALATSESLEQACAAHGVDPDEFIVELKAYLLAL
jgi:hybrid cluster-associated redox disulfide protein